MAGSQLKLLKASLQLAGLTGQTNTKQNNKKKRKTPSETRRVDQQRVVQQIREQFNPFELKMNRVKRAHGTDASTKQVVGRPGISKQIGEEQRRALYELKKKSHNRVGGVVDRRFGEDNPHLNPEEKMLERFTRERQMASKKNSLFNLDDDDEDDNDLALTHYGKTLSLQDDFDEGDLEQEQEQEQPQRKKTKAEVMKEVIAKSKFYKHQRQKEQQLNENEIHELDQEFDDVMQELQQIKPPLALLFAPKSATDIAYDSRIKELAFDRRSVPADRTKTTEELEKERDEKMKKLELDRLKRMQGVDPDDDSSRAVADDLDDDFWAAGDDDDEEEEGFSIKDDAESGSQSESESETETAIKINSKPLAVSCPETQEQFVELLSSYQFSQTNDVVQRILDTYQPGKAIGNKAKLAQFTGVLLQHILYLVDHQSEFEKPLFVRIVEKLVLQLRLMTEKYNETVYELFKLKIIQLQDEINNNDEYEPKVSDLVFYTIVGSFYSTSDLYHLIVTPTLILITETLETSTIERKFSSLCKNVFLCQLLLKYQRYSKRFIPELVLFVERAFLCLVPEVSKVDIAKLSTISVKPRSSFNLDKNDKIDKDGTLQLLQLDDIEVSFKTKSRLVCKLVGIVDDVAQLYKSEPAFVEMISPFIHLLKHLVKYQAQCELITTTLSKCIKLVTNAIHQPLKLQDHKPLAIASNVPKYEENFNPMKKSYDFDPQRQEINKLKLELKKERKLALKDIRKDSKFEARELIKEKKQMYKQYHDKMNSIVNSISTVEGAEKNEYEREKKKQRR